MLVKRLSGNSRGGLMNSYISKVLTALRHHDTPRHLRRGELLQSQKLPSDVHTATGYNSTPKTPGRRALRMQFPLARGPLDPLTLTTALLETRSAAGHLGDLLPDPLRVAHLRCRCELLRVVYEERLGARQWRSCSTLRIGCTCRARRPLRP